MSEPDEAMVEAVASAVDLCVDGWNGEPWSMAQEVARAVLSVPVVRDALARDAQVAEWLDNFTTHIDFATYVAALYLDPEPPDFPVARSVPNPLDALAADGATEIQLWRWESGDGWCAESDSRPTEIADGATPSEAIAALYPSPGDRDNSEERN